MVEQKKQKIQIETIRMIDNKGETKFQMLNEETIVSLLQLENRIFYIMFHIGRTVWLPTNVFLCLENKAREIFTGHHSRDRNRKQNTMDDTLSPQTNS